MATERSVTERLLLDGEHIVFVERGAVVAAATDHATGEMFPIDQFGADKGWLAVTSGQRVVYGYFSSFGGAKHGSSFRFKSWSRDPRGLAFEAGLGPEDICILMPSVLSPEDLHAQMAGAFGGKERQPET